MRKTLFAIVVLFTAGSVFAVPCNQPYLLLRGIAGEFSEPCLGPSSKAIDFISANVSGSTLTVVKRLDKASPQLYLAALNGKHIQDASIVVDSQKQKYLFKDLLISSVTHTAANQTVSEQVTMTFANFELVTGGDAKGSGGTTTPREARINGSARPGAVSVAFIRGNDAAQTAEGFQTTVHSGSKPTVKIQFQHGVANSAQREVTQAAAAGRAPGPLKTPISCIELQAAGGVMARYVVQGNGPQQGGTFQIEKLQLQMPAGPKCAFQSGSEPGSIGWNVSSNAAQ